MKHSYTIDSITPERVVLKCHTGSSDIEISPNHDKYEWVNQNQGRIINISNSGRWTSSNDYTGLYNSNTMNTNVGPVSPKITRLGDLSLNPDMFKPMPTGTAMDKVLSNDGGFLPGTNVMAVGAPGIGKTSLLIDLLYRVMEEDPTRRCLFVSAEMTQMDMARYLNRFPHWARVPILFTGEQEEQGLKPVMESILNDGWDLVLTDSYTEVNDQVKDETNLTRTKCEKWFLDLMQKHNKGENERKLHTTFVTILQVNKGGQFVGSNKLKHLTTSMMHLDWRGGENSHERYVEFSKNRVGKVNQRLYFNLENGVNFEVERFQRDLLNQEMLEQERKGLQEEALKFDEIFGNLTGPNDIEEAVES